MWVRSSSNLCETSEPSETSQPSEIQPENRQPFLTSQFQHEIPTFLLLATLVSQVLVKVLVREVSSVKLTI